MMLRISTVWPAVVSPNVFAVYSFDLEFFLRLPISALKSISLFSLSQQSLLSFRRVYETLFPNIVHWSFSFLRRSLSTPKASPSLN